MRSKDIANLTNEDILFCEMVNEGKFKASEIENSLPNHEEWFMNPDKVYDKNTPGPEEGLENWYPDHEEVTDCIYGDPWCGCGIVDEDYDWRDYV